MARYDVYLVSALADAEKADMLVRRLRALKFKVRHDKKREHTTPTPKDYRDADNSQSVLVIWSKESCNTKKRDSDWVHALAHHARSRDGALVQVALDRSVPDEPFSGDDRYALSGLTARKTVPGFLDLVEELGRRDGRKGLKDWLALKASDKAGKEAWKKKYPIDPISMVGKPKPAPKPAVEAARATAAMAQPTPSAAFVAYMDEGKDLETGWGLLIPVMTGIVLMLILGWAFQSKQGLPAAAHSGPGLIAQCPPGQMPEYLLDQTKPLETGPIIDDTEDEG